MILEHGSLSGEYPPFVDFNGATTTEAGNRLSSFAGRVADELGITLQRDAGGTPLVSQKLTMRATGVSGSSFYLEMYFFTEEFAPKRRRTNPAERVFGGGDLTKRGARIVLELRLETDGRYRWYGVPSELTENVKKVIPTDGRPFILTEDYVADGLRALQETQNESSFPRTRKQ